MDSHAEIALAVLFAAHLIAAGVLVWLAISNNPPGERGWGSWWPRDYPEDGPEPGPEAPGGVMQPARVRVREGLQAGDLTPPPRRRPSHEPARQPARERRHH